jgi:glucose-1-phosphate adenylyltransferase
MKNVIAMVLAGGRVDELSVLTFYRPKSALPFGGMYRVIDFPLSNLMHSGVERVGVLSQYRSYSLINHIGVGSWWDLVGRHRGAYILPPFRGHTASDWYKGTADAVYQNFEFLRFHSPEHVLILSGDHIYKMDYGRLYEYHLAKDADLTAAFIQVPAEEASRFGLAEIDDEDGEVGGRMVNYWEKPKQPQSRWASLTIYLFKARVLYEVLEEDTSAPSREFGRDILPAMIGRYRTYALKFRGFWGYTRTIAEYWHTNMVLLGDRPAIDLEQWQVRTNLDHDRLRDRKPAILRSGGTLRDSRVHLGVEVEGDVERSILFPGVRIGKGARVRDSILMFDTVVEHGAVLDRVITDNDVRVGVDARLGVGDDSPRNAQARDLLTEGLSVIGRGTRIPPGLELGRHCIVYPDLSEEDFTQRSYPSGVTIQ